MGGAAQDSALAERLLSKGWSAAIVPRAAPATGEGAVFRTLPHAESPVGRLGGVRGNNGTPAMIIAGVCNGGMKAGGNLG